MNAFWRTLGIGAAFAVALAALSGPYLPPLFRAAAMLALPVLLLRFLRREHDRLGRDHGDHRGGLG